MIRYLLFDLDNTLYPLSAGLEETVVDRMRSFVATHIGVSPEEAERLRLNKKPAYGTTLEWLMAEYSLADPEPYFRFVHAEGDELRISPEPGLGEMLERIGLPRSVMTNSPREHALRVLKRLGADRAFDSIFDIRFLGLKGKPHETAFKRVLDEIGTKPRETLLIDDIPKYLAGFAAMGGKTLLVDEKDTNAGSGFPRIRSIFDLEGYLKDDSSGAA
jgi:putative hydrolase of the HAD superfamily